MPRLVRGLLFIAAMYRMTTLSLTSGLLFAACSSGSQTPTSEQYDDTAQAIASQTATSGGGGDVASMADSASIALGALPLGFALTGDGHIHGTRLGVDYSYAITCKNLAGAALVACDATTNEAAVQVNWSGTLDTPALTASVTRDGAWTITGLQTATATFSGSGNLSFDATVHSIFRPGVTASYSFDADASYSAVRISTQDRKVIDGTASFDLTAHSQLSGTNHDSDATFDIHAVISFHADHTATLVLDGSHSYQLDLSSGAVVHLH
jgi:hypothetical protein